MLKVRDRLPGTIVECSTEKAVVGNPESSALITICDMYDFNRVAVGQNGKTVFFKNSASQIFIPVSNDLHNRIISFNIIKSLS